MFSIILVHHEEGTKRFHVLCLCMDDFERSCREHGGEVKEIKRLIDHPALEYCDVVDPKEVEVKTPPFPDDHEVDEAMDRVDGECGIVTFKGDFYSGCVERVGDKLNLQLEADDGEDFTVTIPGETYFRDHGIIPDTENFRVDPRHVGWRKYDSNQRSESPRTIRYGAGDGQANIEF